MLNWIREVFAGLTAKHTNCRCCSVEIENGGHGVVFLGLGFCDGCATELMRANAVLSGAATDNNERHDASPRPPRIRG